MNSQKLQSLISGAQKIVILQADNPDADSLASSLALEQILSETGKDVSLYCGIDMPGYLKYLDGWDRVSSELPSQLDLSIAVDASTITLFQKLSESGKLGWVSSKPCIVLDHHGETENSIPFASTVVNDPKKSSTGELIYDLAKELGWPLDKISAEFMMTAILGDTQGLSNDLTSAATYRTMAELVDLGADRPKLEDLRRSLNKMPPEIFRYKAKLIARTDFHYDGKIAIVIIPHQEIMDYSPLYNPNPLIQGEHLNTEGVLVSIAIKQYNDGKTTGSIRCNPVAPIAARLAEHFGGGGHPYSSGFKVLDGRSPEDIKKECLKIAMQILQQEAEG